MWWENCQCRDDYICDYCWHTALSALRDDPRAVAYYREWRARLDALEAMDDDQSEDEFREAWSRE